MTNRVVIVGGGAAGWLTAGILAAKNGEKSGCTHPVRIELVESPNVKNLMVGEGTWPTMRDTLRQIGISEKDFMQFCNAGFKQASKFVGWQYGNGEHYYHPFTAPAGYGAVNLSQYFLKNRPGSDFETLVCAQGAVCEQSLAPKTLATPEFAFALNYGYHLNAGKFTEMLRLHCTQKLGVVHTTGHVEQVNGAPDGDIASVTLSDGRVIEGDLFIDCSGFKALLLNGFYNVPMVCRRDQLFNDAALALQVPYRDENAPVASATVATAQKHGWIWDIALSGRRGIGHVFSRQYCSADQAQDALMQYVKNDPHLDASKAEPRLITFEPGHRSVFWHRNCVAIGVSAGFVEPLEATALVLVEKSVEWISHQFPRCRNAMTVLAKRYNEITHSRWEEIIDFIKLHYVLSSRDDSEYWRAHRDASSVPQSLKDSLALWQTQPPWLYESDRRLELFSSASKQYVLMGMQSTFGEACTGLSQHEMRVADKALNDVRRSTEQLLNGLPTNREFLSRLAGAVKKDCRATA